MMRQAAVLSLVIVNAVATHTAARADCLCAANGLRYEQGETTCIRLSSGSYLARCEKVLNNSSWTKISDDCQDPTESAEQAELALPRQPTSDVARNEERSLQD